MSQVAALRALIEQRFPDATPAVRRTAALVATGVPALDALLPAGGFPLGKLTACRPGGGMTAILRAAAHQVAVAQGDRAAWIDGAGTVAGALWDDGPVLVRPRTPTGALAAADELLRSGGFRLVVLTGVALRDTALVRLVRAAHTGGGALAALTPRATMAALRLHARVAAQGWRWRADPLGEPAEWHAVRVRVEAQALGWHRQAEVLLPVREDDARRLALTPGVVDRRGVGRSPRPAGAGPRSPAL